MSHGLIAACAAAVLIAASCATALAREQKTPPQPPAARSSEPTQPVPGARAPETTGSVSGNGGPLGTAKADSEARRITGSVGRTLERMEEMFRTAEPWSSACPARARLAFFTEIGASNRRGLPRSWRDLKAPTANRHVSKWVLYRRDAANTVAPREK
jgi:hypothetical protein